LKKNNKTQSISTNNKPSSKLISEIIFISLSSIGLAYLVALASYSPLENPWSGDVELTKPVYNLAGVFGAYLSDISLSIFGYASYLIPLALMRWGYNIHKQEDRKQTNKFILGLRFFAFIVLLLFTTAFLSQNTEDPAGGYIGFTMHQYFGVLFGSTSMIIYLGIIMVSFSIASTRSWLDLFSSINTYLANYFTRIRERRMKKRAMNDAKAAITPKKPIQQQSSVSNVIKTRKVKENKKNKKVSPAKPTNLFSTVSATGLPQLDLLNETVSSTSGYSKQSLEDMSRQVEIILRDFGFDVSITTVTPGPVVTQFELSLAPGVKVSQIINLHKDLARALLVESVRIVDVIPGKPVIGLEIPNTSRELINLKEILSTEEYIKSESTLTMALGKDINGLPIIGNLAKMPHLLVAGATGMGKSVGINAIILSVLFKARADQVRIIMIDPKIVELACYEGIPHLLTPVITDMNEAASALWWCVNEMERRYSLLAKFSVRNIDGFNDKINKAKAKNKPLLDPSFNPKNAAEGETAAELEALPQIMLVIDEYADMLGALAQDDRAKAKRVEALIVRLAQKARAAGIHLIISTQRPSVDVITGLIKSNIPTRIAFKVSSKVDSRTILDQGGAEQLLGMGDMLYMTPGISHLTRIHGPFVDDDEILRVVSFLKDSSEPNYLDGILNAQSDESSSSSDGSTKETGELDPLYDEAVQIVTTSRRASISSLQRRMRIGYNRAARIIEDMESSGVVSTMNSAGNRQVLAPEPIDSDN
jgi:S-DNA-T family DNA segregation ATPase FtsK/SpoIIIE